MIIHDKSAIYERRWRGLLEPFLRRDIL